MSYDQFFFRGEKDCPDLSWLESHVKYILVFNCIIGLGKIYIFTCWLNFSVGFTKNFFYRSHNTRIQNSTFAHSLPKIIYKIFAESFQVCRFNVQKNSKNFSSQIFINFLQHLHKSFMTHHSSLLLLLCATIFYPEKEGEGPDERSGWTVPRKDIRK